MYISTKNMKKRTFDIIYKEHQNKKRVTRKWREGEKNNKIIEKQKQLVPFQEIKKHLFTTKIRNQSEESTTAFTESKGRSIYRNCSFNSSFFFWVTTNEKPQ